MARLAYISNQTCCFICNALQRMFVKENREWIYDYERVISQSRWNCVDMLTLREFKFLLRLKIYVIQ